MKMKTLGATIVALVISLYSMLSIMPPALARGGHDLAKCFDAQAQCYASCAVEDTKQARKACIVKKRCFYALREMCPGICEYPRDLCYKTCDVQTAPNSAAMKTCKTSCKSLLREVCPDSFQP